MRQFMRQKMFPLWRIRLVSALVEIDMIADRERFGIQLTAPVRSVAIEMNSYIAEVRTQPALHKGLNAALQMSTVAGLIRHSHHFVRHPIGLDLRTVVGPADR